MVALSPFFAFVVYLIVMIIKDQRDLKKWMAEMKASSSVVCNEEVLEELKSPSKFKKRLTNEEAEKVYKEYLEKHPDTVGDISDQDGDPLYRVYWLAIDRDVKKTEELEYQLLAVSFSMSKDCQGMVVAITNTSDEAMMVDWYSFEVNRCGVLIDGKNRIKYKGKENGCIEPGRTVTKTVQPCEFNKEGVVGMFDLEQIKKEEVAYEISFNVKCGKRSKRKVTYRVLTKIKVIF